MEEPDYKLIPRQGTLSAYFADRRENQQTENLFRTFDFLAGEKRCNFFFVALDLK